MSEQHTPGPLKNVKHSIYSDAGYSIALALLTRSSLGEEHDEANARRLVACWNACEGIDTDDLEAHSVNIINKLHDDAAKRVLSERDELLAALKECIEDSEQAVCEYIEKYGETYRPKRLQAMRDTVAKARAAIAKATGGGA